MKRPRKNSIAAPSYREETLLLEQGCSLVAGLDEAGRGPLAGPVVAGVAVLPPSLSDHRTDLIRDSKQLTPVQRELAFDYLQDEALALAFGISSSVEIDELGIVPATRLAMQRAIHNLAMLPQFLLVDAVTLPDITIPQKSIIHGDRLCLSIAAASIVAKVTRDRIMEREDATYPGYGFAKHKGYGTGEHLQNLSRLGPCKIHRFSFAPIRELKVER